MQETKHAFIALCTYDTPMHTQILTSNIKSFENKSIKKKSLFAKQPQVLIEIEFDLSIVDIFVLFSIDTELNMY